MKHSNITIVLSASALIFSLQGLAADIQVAPGQCESLILEGKLSDSSVALSGAIDARDFAAFEKLPATVKTLDLSGVEFNGITLSDRKCFGRTFFSAGEVPPYAFFKSGVETLILPASVKVISDGAFAGSSIKSVVIPAGVETIGDYAFYNCENLQNVELPSTVTSIGKSAFANCAKLTEINLANTRITVVSERLFAGDRKLQDLMLPATVNTIDREAFTGTAIQVLDLSHVSDFKPYALSGMTHLMEAGLNSAAAMGDGVLMDNPNLSTVSGSPSELPDYFAANCSALDSQTLLSTASVVGRYALANQALAKIAFGSNLSYVDRGAFSGMRLEEIDARSLDTSVPEIEPEGIEGIDPSTIQLRVTDDGFDNWNSHPIWHLFQISSENHSNTVGVTPISHPALDIFLSGHSVVIESNGDIDAVSIYAIDGKLLYSASALGSRVEIDTDRLGANIVIVSAASGAEREKVKLVLK